MDRLNIPSRDIEREAINILSNELDKLGVDVAAASENQMAQQLISMWVRGQMRLAEFERAMQNLMILNPTLKRA